MKFVYDNAPLQEADYVLIGCSDDTGSTAYRPGAKGGPYSIRKVAYERCVFKKKGGRFSFAQVSSGKIDKKLHDYGDVSKKKIVQTV